MARAYCIPESWLDSEIVYTYCPCCGEQRELDDGEVDILKEKGEYEDYCCKCNDDYWIVVEKEKKNENEEKNIVEENMQLTDTKVKDILNSLYLEMKKEGSNQRLILAKAMTLGMKYQEEKIKAGIDCVFENLNLPTT